MKKIFYIFLIGLAMPLYASYFPFDHNLKTKETVEIKHHKHHHDMPVSSIGIVALWSIRFFQIFISPQDGPNCIYYPTCSMYGYMAFQKYGPFKGLLMTSDRWLRCNPFGYPGYDFPEENYFFSKKTKRRKQ